MSHNNIWLVNEAKDEQKQVEKFPRHDIIGYNKLLMKFVESLFQNVSIGVFWNCVVSVSNNYLHKLDDI